MALDDGAHVLTGGGFLHFERRSHGPRTIVRVIPLLTLRPPPRIVATILPALRLRTPLPSSLRGTAHAHPFYKSSSNTTVVVSARNTRVPDSAEMFGWCGSCHGCDGVDGVAAVGGDYGADVPIFGRWTTYSSTRRAGIMRVQLIRKLADQLDGVDVSSYVEGDVLELDQRSADLLIAEGWALPLHEPMRRERRYTSCVLDCAEAAETRCPEPHPQRRAEDRVRDELHDQRARIVKPDE